MAKRFYGDGMSETESAVVAELQPLLRCGLDSPFGDKQGINSLVDMPLAPRMSGDIHLSNREL
jgi:hypothetical protein